jgi:hypothetical protein
MLLSDDGSSWLTNLTGTLTTLYRDRQIIKAQASRVAQGQQPVALPPVSPNLTPLPTPTQQVQYAPQSLPVQFDTRNLVLVGGAVVAAGLAATLLLRRRRGR